MCGITGIICKDENIAFSSLYKAGTLQNHRGPDVQDEELVKLSNWVLGLGHQRLSILDLSDAGKQPMYSHSNNSLIVYNGEVYNYAELGDCYLTNSRRTGTDTEVVIEMLEKFGAEKSLNFFNGMWGFAWFNRKNEKLYIARDRLGVKPLYYTYNEDGFYFGSEVKSVLEACGRKFELDSHVVSDYISQSLQDCTNGSFFKGIMSVPAGCYLEIDLSGNELNPEIIRYWEPKAKTRNISEADALAEVKEIFYDAVKLRMRSDVPIGVTLSGGVDSSAIAAVMTNFTNPNEKLKALSAVSPGSEFDESYFIDCVSEYLDISPEKVSLEWSASEAIELLEKVSWYNDAPLGSFSNVAHYLLMEKANELGIKVILSGQGADELMCGYKKYSAFYFQYLFRNYRFFELAKELVCFIKNGAVVNQFSFAESKRYLPKFFKPRSIDIRGEATRKCSSRFLGLARNESIVERQIRDLVHFSVPYLTHYEDRMSMAWSREIRLPFLDYRFVEAMLSLPDHYKINSGWTKWVFREALQDKVPKEVIWRKDKQGFVNPQEEWLKRDLKPEVLKYFSEDSLIFKYKLVNRKNLLSAYQAFCKQDSGKGGVWYRDIFQPLALEIWLRQYEKYIA